MRPRLTFANIAPISRRSDTTPGLVLAAILALVSIPAAGAQGDIDLGEPSVLSQRGQRLKLAIPYGSAPGERVSSVGIELVSIVATGGARAPSIDRFTTATPERRKVVFMTSAERVDADALTIVYRFAGQSDSLQTWSVTVPPARMAETTETSPGDAPAPRPASSGRPKRTAN